MCVVSTDCPQSLAQSLAHIGSLVNIWGALGELEFNT